MDPAENALHLVEGPVVDRAEPIDDESHTVELPPRQPQPAVPASSPPDRLVPFEHSGLRGWAGRVRSVLARNRVALSLVAATAALPMHFFAGRVDDTIVAAPVLSDLLGGFGLLLLPVMWLAYFAVSALPMVICQAGVVGVVLPAAADGVRPAPGTVWGLVAYRLRTLWLWFTLFGVFAQALPLLLSTDRLGEVASLPLAILLGVAATAALTGIGMLGCVVLIERGRGPRRAAHLLSITPTGGLVAAALALAVLPRLAGMTLGSVAASGVGVVCAVLWAVAALVTYAQARRAEGPVTSVSLRSELATQAPL